MPQEHVDSHVLDDINVLFEDEDIDPTLNDIWKDNITKMDKFRRCLRNLVAINTKELKKLDVNKFVANTPLQKHFEGKSLEFEFLELKIDMKDTDAFYELVKKLVSPEHDQ